MGELAVEAAEAVEVPVAAAVEHIRHILLAFRTCLGVAGAEELLLLRQTLVGVELGHSEEDSQGWPLGFGSLALGEWALEGEAGHTVDTQ